MATKQPVTSLVDFDTSIFAEHYQQSQRWFFFDQRHRDAQKRLAASEMRLPVL